MAWNDLPVAPIDPSKWEVVSERVEPRWGQYDQNGNQLEVDPKAKPKIVQDPGGTKYAVHGDSLVETGYTDGVKHTFLKNPENGEYRVRSTDEESGGIIKQAVKGITSDKKLMAFLAIAAGGAGLASATGSTAMAGLGTEGAVGTFGATGAGSGAVGWTGAAGAAEGAAGVGANSGWSAAMDTAPSAGTGEASGWSAAMDTAPASSEGVVNSVASESLNSVASDAAGAYSDAAQAGYDGVVQQASNSVASAPVTEVTAAAPQATQAASVPAASTPAAGGGSSSGWNSAMDTAAPAAQGGGTEAGSSYWSKVMEFGSSKFGSQILASAASGIGGAISEYYKGDSAGKDKQQDREFKAAEAEKERQFKVRNMNLENMPKINWGTRRVEASQGFTATPNLAAVKQVSTTNKGIITNG